MELILRALEEEHKGWAGDKEDIANIEDMTDNTQDEKGGALVGPNGIAIADSLTL